MIDLRVPRRVGFETPTRWFSGVATEDFFPLADFLNMGVIWVYRLDKKADDRYPNTCAKAFQIGDRRRRDQREHDCNVNRRATPRQAFKERLGKLHLGLDPSARRVFGGFVIGKIRTALSGESGSEEATLRPRTQFHVRCDKNAQRFRDPAPSPQIPLRE